MTQTIRILVLCTVFLSLGSSVFAQKNDKSRQIKVKEEEVYTSLKDRKYHKINCPLLDKSQAKKVSKKKILDQGLFPCLECFREDYPTQTK
ncbi:MAG TPA: hypothetical protein VJA17_03390 [Candidatus Omnitrophota bacterium]|nr:hypothetical protein [Candidatus Omnitrophota bacterium]